jgi:nucleoside-diphosphate-sugar epimerase
MAAARGIELYLLTRGQRGIEVPGAHTLVGDIKQPEQVRDLLADLVDQDSAGQNRAGQNRAGQKRGFDAVVDWIAYTPEDIERDLTLFRGLTRQYVFISSASVYQKPPRHYIITESTPLYNPYWPYSQAKIACEERLIRAYREEGCPVTIVRPSLTYDTVFPVAIGGWGCYTLADRMLRGQPIIVHGDGASLWTVTHAEDFARGFLGLLGHPQAIGDTFHITSDEVLSWNQIYETIADALGVKAEMIHIPSDFISRINPGLGAGLIGDKAWSTVFDNRKIKALVPEFRATIPFHEGIRRTLAWFDAAGQNQGGQNQGGQNQGGQNETRKRVDARVNQEMDTIIAAYTSNHTAGHQG